jgi:hypothetical protein
MKLSQEKVDTQQQREAAEWFRSKMRSRLTLKDRFFVIGTPWYSGDILRRMEKEKHTWMMIASRS